MAVDRRGAVRRSSSASLNARMAVRCWPRDAKPARSRPASSNDEVVAVRPDQRGAIPDLLVGGLGQAPDQGIPWRLAGSGGRVGDVADPQARSRRLPRARSPRGRPPAVPRGRRGAAAAGRRSPHRLRRTSCPSSAARRGTPRPRGWPATGCSAAGGSACRSTGRPRSAATGLRRAGPGRHAGATATRRPAASPRARTRRRAGGRSTTMRGGRCRSPGCACGRPSRSHPRERRQVRACPRRGALPPGPGRSPSG